MWHKVENSSISISAPCCYLLHQNNFILKYVFWKQIQMTKCTAFILDWLHAMVVASCLNKKKKNQTFSHQSMWWQCGKKCANWIRKRKDWVLSERHKSRFNVPAISPDVMETSAAGCWDHVIHSILLSSRLRRRPRGCWIWAHHVFRALRQRGGALERPPS